MNKKRIPHRSKLTTVFSRNLVLFIMIPILAFIFGATVIIRNLMLENAYEKVILAQQNVANSLSSEVRDISIRLSHFLLVNDRNVLQLAEDAAHSAGLDRYMAFTALQESYNLVVTPSSNTIAIHFYTSDGEIIAMKDDAVLPISEIREFEFYKEALSHPEECRVGLIPSSVTYQASRSDSYKEAIAVAFAPENASGDDSIEVICWYANTTASRMISDYIEDDSQGNMYLIDGGGNILIDHKNEEFAKSLPDDILAAGEGRYKQSNERSTLNYIVMDVPDTEWKLVSVIDDAVLLEGFNRTMYIVMVLSIAMFILFAIYSVIFLRNIIRPMNHLIDGMEKVETGDLEVNLNQMGKSEVSALIASFNSMVSRMRYLIESNEQEQAEKHRAEMDALQSQINPHFILNTLSSIRFFAILAKYENIENMADALMQILKSSFKWDDGPYRVSDEIELLKSYFYLMKIRYPERFKVEWDIDDGCLDYGVPRLILQPIVENAIVHGLEEKVDQGTIKVSIQTNESTIVFVVDDDGKGMEAELIDALLHGYSAVPSEDHGIGIANVNRRIQLNFGAQYGIDIESVTGEGSHIKLTIPKLVLGD